MSSGFLIFVVSVLGILTAELFYLAADALVAFVAMLFVQIFFPQGALGACCRAFDFCIREPGRTQSV